MLGLSEYTFMERLFGMVELYARLDSKFRIMLERTLAFDRGAIAIY